MKKFLFQSVLGVTAIAGILTLGSFTQRINHSRADVAFSGLHQVIAAGNFKELIITVNELNEKNMTEVRNAIELQGGIVFKGYCQSMNVLMYLVNTTIHRDNAFLSKLTVLNYTYEVKEGSTIQQVCNACGMQPEANPDPTNQTE